MSKQVVTIWSKQWRDNINIYFVIFLV